MAFQSKFSEVISEVPEEHQGAVASHATLLLNTTGGRPSDAARQAVSLYHRLGYEGLLERHLGDHDAALRACGCSACLADLDRRHAR